jgi:hypothetical protein
MALSFFAAAVLVIVGTVGVVWLIKVRNRSTLSVKTGENSVDDSLDEDEDEDEDEEGSDADEALELGQGLAQSSLQESLSPTMRRQLHLNLDMPAGRGLHSLTEVTPSTGTGKLPRSPIVQGSQRGVTPKAGTPLRRMTQPAALRSSSSRQRGPDSDSEERSVSGPALAW